MTRQHDRQKRQRRTTKNRAERRERLSHHCLRANRAGLCRNSRPGSELGPSAAEILIRGWRTARPSPDWRDRQEVLSSGAKTARQAICIRVQTPVSARMLPRSFHEKTHGDATVRALYARIGLHQLAVQRTHWPFPQLEMTGDHQTSGKGRVCTLTAIPQHVFRRTSETKNCRKHQANLTRASLLGHQVCRLYFPEETSSTLPLHNSHY